MLIRALSLVCLFVFAFLPISIVYGQLQKGMSTLLLDSEASYNNREEISIFNSRIGGQVGIMLSNRFMLGAGIDASYNRNQGTNVYRITANPFARFYLNPAQPKTNFFLGMEADITSNFGDFPGGTNTSIYPHLGANHFLYSDVSILARAGILFPLEIPDISILAFQFSFEPFFYTSKLARTKVSNQQSKLRNLVCAKPIRPFRIRQWR